MDDEGFVADVFDASYPRIVAQMSLVCGDVAGAEDAVQEAFVRALDRAHDFRLLDNPEAWLFRVALNIQRSRWRRMKVFMGLRHRIPESSEPFEPSADHVAMVEALGALPIAQRETIVLHHLADLPVREVARILGVPEGTVKTRLARGRAALADLMLDSDEERHV